MKHARTPKGWVRARRSDKAGEDRLTGVLEEFIRAQYGLPQAARAILDWEELPWRLRPRAMHVGASSQWRAWVADGCIRFVVGTRVHEPRLDPQGLALKVLFFDEDGASVACAVWLRRCCGRWVLYRILDVRQSDPPRFISREPEQACLR